MSSTRADDLDGDRSPRRWTRPRAAAALGAAASLGCGLAVATAGRAPPDFARVAAPAGGAERRVPPPVLMLPRADVERGNGVACVFVDAGAGDRVRFTVVYGGESHPWPLLDRAYDVYRAHRWGRVMDDETFTVRLGPDGAPIDVDLEDVAAGEQTWSTPVPRHLDGTVAWGDLERRDGRPVLWVATWNHMLAPRDRNPGLEHVAVAGYPLYRGSRAEVEALFAR